MRESKVFARLLTLEEYLELRNFDTAITLDEIYDDVPMPPLTIGEEGEEEEW